MSENTNQEKQKEHEQQEESSPQDTNNHNSSKPHHHHSSSKKNLNDDEKRQKEIEMAKEYQKVTRSLAREISKKDGFSLVSHVEEPKVESPPVVEEEPVKEPDDGLQTQTTFKAATTLLLGMEVCPLRFIP